MFRIRRFPCLEILALSFATVQRNQKGLRCVYYQRLNPHQSTIRVFSTSRLPTGTPVPMLIPYHVDLVATFVVVNAATFLDYQLLTQVKTINQLFNLRRPFYHLNLPNLSAGSRRSPARDWGRSPLT